MNHYKLRISNQQSENLELFSDIKKLMWCYEVGKLGRDHMHFHVETRLKRDSLVKRLVKLKHYEKGNGFYSLQTLKSEDDGYLSYDAYLTKEGKYDFKGYSEAEKEKIATYQVKYLATVKERKKKKRTQLEILCELYEASEVRSSQDAQAGEGHPAEVCKFIIDWYIENGKLIREFQIKSLTQTILCKYHNYSTVLSYNIVKYF